MTEEVTDAMRAAIVGAWLAGARAAHDEWAKADEGQRFYLSRDHEPDFTEAAHDYAASNSQTTDGEVAGLRAALEEIQRHTVNHWGWVFYVQRLATEALAKGVE